MESNINVSNINHFFSQNKKEKTVKFRTKIVNHSHFSINEASISKNISKIPYYLNFFSILYDYESLNISQLDGAIIKKLNNTSSEKYYLFKYNDLNSTDFADNLYSYTSSKKLIFFVIESFSHTLQGLSILNQNDICFLNISHENIIFLEDYREKPVLTNFKFGLQINKLDYNYISHILNKIENFTYLPVELHILFYFIKSKMITISYSFIEEFSENFIKNFNILNLFSEEYKEKYKKRCVETMKKYINRQQNEIIDDILERNNKWDVYGISVLYLQIFGNISRVFSLKGTFISKVTILLSKNLHPDSDKRMTLDETLDTFNKLLNEEKDWSYVNKLDNNKLSKLFDEFSK